MPLESRRSRAQRCWDEMLTLDQTYGAYSALNIDCDCCRSFAVGGIDVVVVLFREAIRAYGADSAGGVNFYADVFGESDRCGADAALNFDVEIIFSRAGKIELHFARADVDVDATNVEIAKPEVALAGTHLQIQIEGHVVGEAQIPGAVSGAEMQAFFFA